MDSDGPEAEFKKFMVPRYDELTLYIHGVSFLLVLAINTGFRENTLRLLFHDRQAFIMEAAALCGAVYSIFHVFSRKKKSFVAKTLMLVFIIYSNLFVALYGLPVSNDSVETAVDLYKIPIIFNLLYAFTLIIMWRFDSINESSIADEDATLPQVLFVSIPLAATFFYCNSYDPMPWYATYSWAVSVSLIAKHVALHLFPDSGLVYRPQQFQKAGTAAGSGSPQRHPPSQQQLPPQSTRTSRRTGGGHGGKS